MNSSKREVSLPTSRSPLSVMFRTACNGASPGCSSYDTRTNNTTTHTPAKKHEEAKKTRGAMTELIIVWSMKQSSILDKVLKPFLDLSQI